MMKYFGIEASKIVRNIKVKKPYHFPREMRKWYAERLEVFNKGMGAKSSNLFIGMEIIRSEILYVRQSSTDSNTEKESCWLLIFTTITSTGNRVVTANIHDIYARTYHSMLNNVK